MNKYEVNKIKSLFFELNMQLCSKEIRSTTKYWKDKYNKLFSKFSKLLEKSSNPNKILIRMYKDW